MLGAGWQSYCTILYVSRHRLASVLLRLAPRHKMREAIASFTYRAHQGRFLIIASFPAQCTSDSCGAGGSSEEVRLTHVLRLP